MVLNSDAFVNVPNVENVYFLQKLPPRCVIIDQSILHPRVIMYVFPIQYSDVISSQQETDMYVYLPNIIEPSSVELDDLSILDYELPEMKEMDELSKTEEVD